MAYRRGRRRRSSYNSYSVPVPTTPPPNSGEVRDNAPVYYDGGTFEDMHTWCERNRASHLVSYWRKDRSWGTDGLTDEQIRAACTAGLTPDPTLVPSETDSDWLPPSLKVRYGRQKYWGVGAPLAWNVGSLIAGTPDYALRIRKAEGSGPVVALVVSGTVSAGVPASDLVKRAAGVCNAVRDIQSTGRAVEIYIACDVQGSKGGKDGGVASVRVKVKGADEVCDTALLFFTLGHPGVLRGMLYPYAEYVMKKAQGTAEADIVSHYDGGYVGYCTPVDPVRWPDDPGSAVIPCVYYGDPDWQSRIRTVITSAFGTPAE